MSSYFVFPLSIPKSLILRYSMHPRALAGFNVFNGGYRIARARPESFNCQFSNAIFFSNSAAATTYLINLGCLVFFLLAGGRFVAPCKLIRRPSLSQRSSYPRPARRLSESHTHRVRFLAGQANRHSSRVWTDFLQQPSSLIVSQKILQMSH